MRGKEWPAQPIVRKTGITPACAGKSGYDLPDAVVDKDHPRVCGEKSWQVYTGFAGWGSPPRVRGKVTSVFI